MRGALGDGDAEIPTLRQERSALLARAAGALLEAVRGELKTTLSNGRSEDWGKQVDLGSARAPDALHLVDHLVQFLVVLGSQDGLESSLGKDGTLSSVARVGVASHGALGSERSEQASRCWAKKTTDGTKQGGRKRENLRSDLGDGLEDVEESFLRLGASKSDGGSLRKGRVATSVEAVIPVAGVPVAIVPVAVPIAPVSILDSRCFESINDVGGGLGARRGSVRNGSSAGLGRVDDVHLAGGSKVGGEAEQADKGLVIVSVGIANRVARIALAAAAAVAVRSNGDELSVGLSQDRGTRLSYNIFISPRSTAFSFEQQIETTLTSVRRNLILNHVTRARVEVVVILGVLLVHLSAKLIAPVGILHHLVARIPNDAKQAAPTGHRSDDIVEGAQVASVGSIDLDKGHVTHAVVGRLDPLGRGDDVDAVASLHLGRLDRRATVVANVAPDLRGSAVSVSPVVDDVAGRDEEVGADQPSRAHHPDGSPSGLVLEAGLDLDNGWWFMGVISSVWACLGLSGDLQRYFPPS